MNPKAEQSLKKWTFSARIVAVMVKASCPLSAAEIAARSGASPAAVKVNLHRLDKMGALVKHQRTYEIRKGKRA